jgi:sugar phosphate isomerase/epimerase
MKTGFNLLLWTGHVTTEHTSILKGIKKAGYDTVEIPIFEALRARTRFRRTRRRGRRRWITPNG